MFFISSQMPLAQVCPKIYLSSKLRPGAALKRATLASYFPPLSGTKE